MDERALSARVIAPADLSESERERWTSICDEWAPLQSPFMSWQYAHAVGITIATARVCIISQSRRPVAFLPFQFESGVGRWLKAAEPAGGRMTDYFGLIAPPSFRISPRRLLRLAGIDSFLFHHLDESQQRLGLAGDHPRVGLCIDLSDVPAYLEGLRSANKDLVRDTERRRRKIVKDVGPLRFEFRSKENGALSRLIEAKLAQYERTNQTRPVLESAWARDLIAELSRLRDRECEGVLSVLMAGDVWVAMHFGLLGRGTLHYWFPVYNPALRAYAPGRLLLMCMIENARELQIARIDRGEGDSLAKREFANAEHTFLAGAWGRPGFRFLAHRFIKSVTWRADKFRTSRIEARGGAPSSSETAAP